MRKAVLASLAAGAALAIAMGSASAQQEERIGVRAGDFMFRGRILGVFPLTTDSDISLIGGHVDATITATPEIDLTYFVTDNIAFELIAGTTVHHITARDTALGDVSVGNVFLLPPSLTAQWHFSPHSRLDPYVGAGINYTFFYGATATGDTVRTVTYDNNVGAVVQAGVNYNFDGPWFLNVDVKQIFLSTTAHINDGAIDADVDLNPLIVGVGIGVRF